MKRSVESLTRLAAAVALLGLATFALSMLYPRPLVVIFSMSAGHLIGALALALYLLAVVLDIVRAQEGPAPTSQPTEAEPPSSASSAAAAAVDLPSRSKHTDAPDA